MKDKDIARRQFMQYSAAGVFIAASSGKLFGSSNSVPRPKGDVKESVITTKADVLVVGGGAAGTRPDVPVQRRC